VRDLIVTLLCLQLSLPAYAAGVVAAVPTDVHCENLLRLLKATDPSSQKQEALLKTKRDLEDRRDANTRANNLALAYAQSDSIRFQEQILFALDDGGDPGTQQILALIRPVARKVWASYDKLYDLASRMETLKAGASQAELARWEVLSNDYERESQAFGENYGPYMRAMTLLRSVAVGKGAPEPDDSPGQETMPATADVKLVEEIAHELTSSVPIVTERQQAVKPRTTIVPTSEPLVLLNLTKSSAIASAQSVLKLLNPEVESQTFSSRLAHSRMPSDDELRLMFKGNIYALIAKLKLDYETQAADTTQKIHRGPARKSGSECQRYAYPLALGVRSAFCSPFGWHRL
jgi:hypothetical protein